MQITIEKNISYLGIVAWLIAAIFFLYEFFLRTFLGALAKQIMPALHLSPGKFAALASVFYIAYGLMQVPVGAITDKLGVKKAILLAVLICAVATFMFSSADNFFIALLARFLMGLGGGFAFICLLVVTIEWFPKKYLALLVGLGQFFGTMGALCAGGPLAVLVARWKVPWREVFIYIGFWGLLLLVLSFLFIRPRQQQRNKVVIRLKVNEKLNSAVEKFKAVFVSSQALWVAVYSAFVFLTVAMLGAVWGTLYLQSLGFTQELSATIISFAWLGFAVGCPLLGGLSDCLIRRKPIMVACAVVGLLCVMFLVYFPLSSAWIYEVLFFILGISSAGQSIGFAIITEHVKPELQSMALGLNSAFITLLAAIVPLIVGFILQRLVNGGAVRHYSYHNFRSAFVILPILYLLALLVSLFFIEETFCRVAKKVVVL